MRLRTPTLSVVARVIPCLIACALGTAGLSACSSGLAASDRGVTVVRVTVRDFHIKVSPARIPAGPARLVVVLGLLIASIIWFSRQVLFVIALTYMLSGIFWRLHWLFRRKRNPPPPPYTEASQTS